MVRETPRSRRPVSVRAFGQRRRDVSSNSCGASGIYLMCPLQVPPLSRMVLRSPCTDRRAPRRTPGGRRRTGPLSARPAGPEHRPAGVQSPLGTRIRTRALNCLPCPASGGLSKRPRSPGTAGYCRPRRRCSTGPHGAGQLLVRSELPGDAGDAQRPGGGVAHEGDGRLGRVRRAGVGSG